MFGILSAILLFGASVQSASASTEYLVRADGAVAVLSGVAAVSYNASGNQGSVKATVPFGYIFHPATGTVDPITASDLHNIIADVVTTKLTTRSYQFVGGKIVVKS